MKHSRIQDVLKRKLIFVSGKGGVGKTTVSQAIAEALARKGRRALWVVFEDPTQEPGRLLQKGPRLWHINAEATRAFEEYVGLKLGAARLTKLFLQNKVMNYLSKAAPGIHELVLLGKVWHERQNYDHVVCDMPSTGYGLAMFQSAENFSRLFQGGPINRDAEAMLATFRSPEESGFLTVALPEEMPLVESIELGEFLLKLFPDNPSAYVANRLFPKLSSAESAPWKSPDDWKTPVPESALDYATKRSFLEAYNLRLWREIGVEYGELPYLPPPSEESFATTVSAVSEECAKRGYL